MMNEEKPAEAPTDGRPFDGGLGPTAQAAQGVPIGRPQLSGSQLHGDTSAPSWKAPKERRGVSNGAIVAIIVVLVIVLLVVLKVAGVF